MMYRAVEAARASLDGTPGPVDGCNLFVEYEEIREAADPDGAATLAAIGEHPRHDGLDDVDVAGDVCFILAHREHARETRRGVRPERRRRGTTRTPSSRSASSR